MNSDPDPAFHVNPDPDTDPARILGFDDQKLEENRPFTVQYLYLALNEGHPSYWRSLQPSKENIRHFKK
jgi:hypothetical protein